MKRSSRASFPRHVRASDESATAPEHRHAPSDEPQTAASEKPRASEATEATETNTQIDAPSAKSVLNELYARLAAKCGKRGAKSLRVMWISAIFTVLAIGTVAPYKSEILAKPVVADNVERVFGDALPTAQPGAFTIIIVDFDGDDNGST